MKKFLGVMFIGFFSVCMLAGCNKAGSDNSGIMALLGLGGGGSGTFTKVYGTVDSNSDRLFSNQDVKNQYLYLASEIGGSGYITKIRVQRTTAGAEATCNNVTIRMGHTDITAVTTQWADNVDTGQGAEVTVLDNKTIAIPAVAANSRWIEITLDTPFNYNGVDNLIVDFERTTACSATVNNNFAAVTDRLAGDSAAGVSPGVAEWDTVNAYEAFDELALMQFVFAGGDNKLEYATTGQPLPFMAASHIRQQMLYKAGEINGRGVITGVGFAVATSPVSDCNYTVTVRLGHTNLEELGTTSFDDNYSGSYVTVANAAAFKVPANAAYASYVWLPFSRSFTYDISSNLIVDVEVSDGSAGLTLRCDTPGSYTMVYSSSGGALTPSDLRYAVKFRFKGGTVGLITDGSWAGGPPFHGTNTGQVQPLYRTSELGLNGSITGLGLRLSNDSLEDTYEDFSIIMGHTDKNALVATESYNSNMDDAVTVFTGTLSIPSGLEAGDWIDIPFDTAFTCTPGRNLAIYFKSDAGSGIVDCNYVQGDEDINRYAGRLAFSNSQISSFPNDDGDVLDRLFSIRFAIE